MTRIAIIGSGPTGIYSLKGLIASKQPLTIAIFEETPDAGKGTPYHPAVNDRAMLANIASIELPPIARASSNGSARSRSRGCRSSASALRILANGNSTPVWCWASTSPRSFGCS
jgi:cation diffusion facilitator CzcD-associated flavoprotein CzcO